MKLAERTRTIQYVLLADEITSRWLLHTRRDTKKINIPGCREKNKKRQKRKTNNWWWYALKLRSSTISSTPRVSTILVHYVQQYIFTFFMMDGNYCHVAGDRLNKRTILDTKKSRLVRWPDYHTNRAIGLLIFCLFKDRLFGGCILMI